MLFGGVRVGVQDGAGSGGLDGDAAEVVCGGVVEFAGDAGAFVGEECLVFCLSKAVVAEDDVAGDDADVINTAMPLDAPMRMWTSGASIPSMGM